MEPRSVLAIASELRARCRGEVLADQEQLAPFAHDFGAMRARTPAIVVRPAVQDDVLAVLRFAAQHGLPLTTRGAGHSQSGQGLGEGLVLDMTGLDRVLAIDRERALVEVEGGASWRSVVDAAFAHGLLPVALTHALDPTVAGTLSVAGVGAESFRLGAQVDNVEYLDVALLSGEVVRCSTERERELFDAVRSGLGQCGVILRAGYPLRRAAPALRVYGHVYAEPERFLSDAAALADPLAAGRWLTGLIARDPLRARRWLLLLWVGEEIPAPADRAPLPELHSDFAMPIRELPLWGHAGAGHPFFRVFGSPSDRPTPPALLNPWVEHLFSPDAAVPALRTVLGESAAVLARGQAAVIFVRRAQPAAPLFAVPTGDLLVGIGAFASFPASERTLAEAMMAEHVQRLEPFAGKRYLSGFFARHSAQDFRDHYGADAFRAFAAAKLRCDRRGLLNPGFIPWELQT